MSLKSNMGELKKLWAKGKEQKMEFDSSVPDGVYVGKINMAEFGESQNSGRPQVAWAAKISVGEFKGETVRWWSGLKTEQNMMFLQRDIARLGKEVPEGIEDLEDILKEIENEKPSIRFRVKTDGEFTNIRVLKKLSSADAEDADEEETEEEEEVAKEEPKDVEPETEEEEVVEETEEEVVEEEEPTLEVGLRAAFDLKGKEVVGEVTKIDKENETAVVKVDGGAGSFKVKYEKLRPAPKTKVKKK